MRYIEVLHLFSGPERDGDFSHWIKVLAGAQGIIAHVTNVDYLFPSARYGSGDLSDTGLCDRILVDIDAGMYDVCHSGTPCNTWSMVRKNKGGPEPIRSSQDPMATWMPTGYWEYNKLQLHNHLFYFTFDSFKRGALSPAKTTYRL